MLIKPDCIPCILTMALTSMRRLALDERDILELYGGILQIPSLRGDHWDRTSPEVLEQVMELIVGATGSVDPFHDLKEEQNRRIMEICPFLRQLIHDASDPLKTAVKLAILGNTIDLMMGTRPTDVENRIEERLRIPLHERGYAEFREGLSRSELLVYLGDNAGEIVFDRLLIQVIRERYPVHVVFIVRNVPTLNDVTLNEARSVGMDQTATILENGMDGPCPGTVFERCSEEVRGLIERADMIVSKGGGNFDSFSEVNRDLRDKTIFMLLSKCYPYCEFFGVQLHRPVITGLRHAVP
ncbi:MAG: DUF89 family protein [Deltaproteobacteria bacterium]|nr:DUF89 family protein [Deltaproteobacteria bacterium]MBW2047590.1 DUF89 family protein [Deltaproteobacteria bacterium]MBW2112885.1 DUF89 family protein [Deltaproteobacteria bacterium]MBW2353926.1 DUF89 family protein [Deltaproteobacteria bacterium]HDZ91864.1 DUF89 family protein [Deltaproteobacteria bacterium]